MFYKPSYIFNLRFNLLSIFPKKLNYDSGNASILKTRKEQLQEESTHSITSTALNLILMAFFPYPTTS